MKELDKFLFQPKKFEDIIKTATIVVDTNVLLAAYQYRNITFKELLHTLEELNKEKRLLIPSQVIKEFFKNRPNRIVEIIQKVEQLRNELPNIKEIDKIERKVPGIEYLQNHSTIGNLQREFVDAHINYKKAKESYHKELEELLVELRSFFTDDPILEQYKEIFRATAFKPESLKSEEEMAAEYKIRVNQDLPPGNKDANKKSNGEGDYIIWEHILRISESDVIFVTADNKADWVYKDSNDRILGARRELIEEFYESSNGRTLSIVHPSSFIAMYNPNVKEEVIEDIKSSPITEEGKSNMLKFFNFKDISNYYYSPTKREEPTWDEQREDYFRDMEAYSELHSMTGLSFLLSVMRDMSEENTNENKIRVTMAIVNVWKIRNDDGLSLVEKDKEFLNLAVSLKSQLF